MSIEQLKRGLELAIAYYENDPASIMWDICATGVAKYLDYPYDDYKSLASSDPRQLLANLGAAIAQREVSNVASQS